MLPGRNREEEEVKRKWRGTSQEVGGDCQGTPLRTRLRMGLRVAGSSRHCIFTLYTRRKTPPIRTVLLCHITLPQPKPALGPLRSTPLVLCPYLFGTAAPAPPPQPLLSAACQAVMTASSVLVPSPHAISPTSSHTKPSRPAFQPTINSLFKTCIE